VTLDRFLDQHPLLALEQPLPSPNYSHYCKPLKSEGKNMLMKMLFKPQFQLLLGWSQNMSKLA